MHPYLSLLVVVLVFGSYGFGAQVEPVTAPVPESTTRAEPPAPAAPEKTQAAVDAAIAQMVETVARESKPAGTEAVAATSAAATTPVPVTTEPAASAAPPSAPSVPTTAAAPPSDNRTEWSAARMSVLEQLLLAQIDQQEARYRDEHARSEAQYRDLIRMLTTFGGAFAGLCMIGLLAAAFLNYRAMMAIQTAYQRVYSANATLPSGTNGALPAPGGAAVPGIERVQASGQRFQSRMTGLEQRLAELEHMAGREPSVNGDGSVARTDAPPAPTAEEAGLVAPPVQVVPRAMILVHKAQALANLGKLTDALATLDEASAFDGAKTEVNLARGQVLEKLGRLGDALRAYDTAVVADDHNTSALLLKAGVLNRQERFSEALACYERALEVHRAAV